MAKLLYLLLIFFPAGLFAQATISGRVVNQADNKPIPDASVFLSNATVGGKTGANGTFILNNVKPGKYDLVVSVVGFQNYSQTISVESLNLALPVILLAPKTIALGEVRVRFVTDPKREKYYKWFKDDFLGTSWRAADTKILNPEMLDFHYNDTAKTLAASSEDFLKVDNNALGYQIKYLLTEFINDRGVPDAEKLLFRGSALFEEMKGSRAEEKRWQRKRLEIYEGSLMHFLRCALNNTFEDAGFRVYRIFDSPNPQRPPDSLIMATIRAYLKLAGKSDRYTDSLNYWEAKAALPRFIQTFEPKSLKQTDFIKTTGQKGVYALTGNNGSLLVVYYKNNDVDGAEQPGLYYDPLKKLKTTINFNDGYALFDRNGNLTDPASLSIAGAWADDRLAELLPVDYDPSANGQQDTGKTVDLTVPATQTGGNSDSLRNSLLALKAKSDSAGIKLIPDKLYIQFDKSYYAVGDTIWFKAYLLNNFLAASGKSGILNIDIANDSNKVIRRYRLPVQSGLAWGNIQLDDKYFAAGTYTLRAYTNWMRNFGDENFFFKTILVSGATSVQPLVNAAFGNSTINGNPSIEAKLRFTTVAGLPLATQSITLQLINDGKHLGMQKYLTGADGVVNLNFTPPQKAVNPSLFVLNEKKERMAVIPIPVNRGQDADVQFLPEGGGLVAGLPARIGFKAIGEDGKGVDVSGVVVDHTQKQVAVFKSPHNGMGSFDMLIAEHEIYTVQVTSPGGLVKQYALPLVKSSGTVLSIKNEAKSDSLHLTAAASNDIAASGQSFFLIGRARGVVCYAAIVNFHESGSVSKKIAKSLFPSGIAHFTLMTMAYLPVNERLVFIGNSDKLNIKLSTDKPYYGKRDSVALKLKVTNQDGEPVSGNFSLAVTDDGQVKPDSLNEVNINTHLLLTDDLKGYIEEPGYYLSAQNPENWQALDNLLLTQGWIGYDWKQVFTPPAITFQPALESAVTGNVYNVMNKPVKGTHIFLFSKSPAILVDTVTDSKGNFVFDRLPRVDSPLFILKAVNKSGKSFNVGIKVDDVAPPVFAKPWAPVNQPWFVNIDSTLLSYTKNAAQLKQQNAFVPGTHVLKEVTIKGKKIIKDSQNLNGSGNADFVMDEKDLEVAGKKTWLQLLYENIKGFGEGSFDVFGHGPNALKQNYLNKYVTNFNPDPVSHQWYFINRQPVIIVVDGISVSQIIATSTFRDLREYLSHSAEDIKGMEVVTSSKFAASYLTRYDPIDPTAGEQLLLEVAEDKRYPISIVPSDIAFIEITTRSGHGPVIGNTPGVYLYKQLPLSWPKAFYKPKYTVKDTLQNRLDLRSTIDWEPNIVTDTNGEAKIWFYTADKSSTYTMTIEGTDMNGCLGYKQAKINVGTNKEKTR